MDLRLIEEVSLNAWPALKQTLYDGWVLRFSEGYTKRANSVTPLYHSTLGLEEKIRFCENAYTEQGLPPIFRLTEPFATPDLDSALAERDYQMLDPTRVMGLDLSILKSQEFPELLLRELPLDTWLEIFSKLSGYALDKQPLHKKILEKILSPALMICLEVSGQPVTCGLGVLQMGVFGLFDIVTHPDHRNRGLGTQLVTEMLNWGRACGAKQAYLQVMESNPQARHLYSKLGFRDLYRYWYRITETR